MNRTKKLVITAPILIATALGTAAIATAAGTAHVIATNESTKVLTTEKAHRVEDINNGVFNNKINLGLIGEVAKDIDSVRKTAAHSSHAFTNLNQAIQLNNEFNYLVSMITIIPLSDFSEKCQDRLILKTTLVPIVNHRTRWEVVSENGRLYQKNGNKSSRRIYFSHMRSFLRWQEFDKSCKCGSNSNFLAVPRPLVQSEVT